MRASNVVLIGVCSVALAIATAMVVRWGRLQVDASPLLVPDQRPGTGRLLARVSRSVAMGMLAGAIAGVLVLGFGGRLAMRVLAATSNAAAQGRLTKAQERVGAVTFDGTMALIVFVGLAGGFVGGLAYVALRRWLRGPAWQSGLIAGTLGLVVARLDPLDPRSVDFRILSPTGLAIALFLLLFLGYGVVLASLMARLDLSYPEPSRRPRALVAYSPLLLTLPVPIVFLTSAALVLVVIAVSRSTRFRVAWRDPAVDVGGRIVLAIGGVAGLTWLGAGISQILRA